MGRVAKKIALEEMVDAKGFCEMISRSSSYFKRLKKEGIVIPCAKMGYTYLYKKSDAIWVLDNIIIHRFPK